MRAPKRKAAEVLATPAAAQFETTFSAASIGDTESSDKSFGDLKIAFAFKGHELRRVVLPDGKQIYRCQKWGMVRELPSIVAAVNFLLMVGGVRR